MPSVDVINESHISAASGFIAFDPGNFDPFHYFQTTSSNGSRYPYSTSSSMSSSSDLLDHPHAQDSLDSAPGTPPLFGQFENHRMQHRFFPPGSFHFYYRGCNSFEEDVDDESCDRSFWRSSPSPSEEDKSDDGGAYPVTFDLNITAHHHVTWNGVLDGKRLILPLHEAGGNSIAASSKEGFVSLLEFAEEELGCEHIVIIIPKRAKERGSLVKTFMFMGFTMLTPAQDQMARDPDNVYLDYEI
ncbi:unnamed protein product [Cyprideis torosa]|uniref:Ornithine decarboxylase antizyme n=1 Tax=Cyprideis torosa TaxID=163714 RepID=A0A7R8W6D4_9CRUS|nr:unnamed protein product [Cyprideis torosa]CAG0886303.1 unnamed protein product [Cyprideis torosa]